MGELIKEVVPYLGNAPVEFWFVVLVLGAVGSALYFAYQVIKLLVGKLE